MKTIVRKPDQRNTAKSQRVTRIERGMRPREAVHARQTARRAQRSFKGTPCNS